MPTKTIKLIVLNSFNLFCHFPKGDGCYKKQFKGEEEQKDSLNTSEENSEQNEDDLLQDREQNNSSTAMEENSEQKKGTCESYTYMHQHRISGHRL